MKKFNFILGLIMVFAILLSACQQASSPTEAPSAAPDNAPATDSVAAPDNSGAADNAPESDGEVIELAFWTLLGGANGDRVQKLVDDFNASQDGIVIINESQGGYDDLQQKLLASLAAGNPPPITMVDYKYVPFYAKNGAFEPINNLASKEDLADYIPGLLTDLTYKGQVYAIPFNRSTQGMFYNKDLMREAGLDPEAPRDLG